MARYAEIEDLYAHGVPHGTLVSQALLISSVDATLNRIEVGAHGLVTDREIFFVADEDGVLPAPLAELTAYYARRVSSSVIEVAATVGGAAIDLTDEGTAPFRLHIDLEAKANGILEAKSRDFDQLAIGHAVPFEVPYPDWVTATVAAGAATEVQWALRQIGFEEYKARDDLWFLKTKRIASGGKVRDERATGSANLARGASPTDYETDDEATVLP